MRNRSLHVQLVWSNLSLDDQKFPDAENQRCPNPPRCHKSLIFISTQICYYRQERDSQKSIQIVLAKVGALNVPKRIWWRQIPRLASHLSKLIRLHTCPKNKPDLGRPPHRNFVHQKNYDRLKNNLKNNIERVPIDSAHFYLHRGLDLEPVPIALPPQVGGYRKFWKNDNEKVSPSSAVPLRRFRGRYIFFRKSPGTYLGYKKYQKLWFGWIITEPEFFERSDVAKKRRP